MDKNSTEIANTENTANTLTINAFDDRRVNPEWPSFQLYSAAKRRHCQTERRRSKQVNHNATWWLKINYVDNEYFEELANH